MRTRTVEVREGELLGPIDWSYDFRQHFDNYGSSNEARDEACEKCKSLLRQIETDPASCRVQVSHSFVEKDVYSLGMYDGWPYWKPTPAILTSGTLGAEWHFFYDIRAVEPKLL